MFIKIYCFVTLILASILSYVTAGIIGHGSADPYHFLALFVAFNSVVGFGTYINIKGWA